MFVDSSFLAALGQDEQAAVEFHEEHANESVHTSTVVAFELFGGLVSQGHEDLVNELREDLRWVDFHPFALDDAAETARIDATLASDGRRIPVPDAMIAAAARNRDATLVAADGHFERVPDLDYVNFRTA